MSEKLRTPPMKGDGEGKRLGSSVAESGGSPPAAAKSGGQSAADFRAALAKYPNNPRAVAHDLYWSRGAVSKDLKSRTVVMLRDLAVILEVAASTDGVLGFRNNPEGHRDSSRPEGTADNFAGDEPPSSAESSLALAIGALERIADGKLTPESHAHYLAHRNAINLARETLSKIKGGGADG